MGSPETASTLQTPRSRSSLAARRDAAAPSSPPLYGRRCGCSADVRVSRVVCGERRTAGWAGKAHVPPWVVRWDPTLGGSPAAVCSSFWSRVQLAEGVQTDGERNRGSPRLNLRDGTHQCRCSGFVLSEPGSAVSWMAVALLHCSWRVRSHADSPMPSARHPPAPAGAIAPAAPCAAAATCRCPAAAPAA